jgi:hypothetical protein
MKKVLSSLVILVCVYMGGCMVPAIQPWLWRASDGNVPTEIVLARPVSASNGKGKNMVIFQLPAGKYTRWHENKFGYYFRQEGAKVKKTSAGAEPIEIEGGFQLGKRIDQISIYHLVSLAEDSKKHGELSYLSAWEQGDKDGMTRNFAATIPREFYPEFGFPSEQPQPK